MKNALLTGLKFAIGIALVYWLYRSLENPNDLWQQLHQANKPMLLTGAFCYTAAVALSAVKWGVLLRASGIQVQTSRLLAYQWIAEFFNNFLPAQVGGDIMRGYALASDTAQAADAAASVLVDRFIGLLVFMLAATFAAITMLIWGRPNGAILEGNELLFTQFTALGSGVMTLILGAMLAIILSERPREWLEQLFRKLPLSRHSVPIWQKLAQVFSAYRRHKQALLWTALGSTVIVILTSINIWLIARAIQPDGIALLEVLAINPIIVFVALALPLSPGGLGVRQGAFAATFLLIGANKDLGIQVGLVQQFIGYLVSLPGGYFWLLGRIRQKQSPQYATVDTSIKPHL